jgi:spore germination protein YaaH
MKKFGHIIVIFFAPFFILGVFVPRVTHATTATSAKKVTSSLQVAGWIPYWRTTAGTADATVHITDFTEISPFGFTVKNDGELYDAMNLSSTSWQTLIATARTNGVKVIPTITWSDPDAIDAVLRNPTLRKAQVHAIITMLNTYNFDGVDIDYENKYDTTENYFSLFLQELWNATGKRLVVCSIEPRTPLTSRFDVIPKNVTYANDYTALNKYCDHVRIMTYDQGTVDLRLDASAVGPYNPIADTQWVTKVIQLAEQTISKKKIFIGVATYGHEYEVTPVAGGYTYNFLTSFDPAYATNIASAYDLAPLRDSAGELNVIYTPTSTAPVAPLGDNQTNNTPIATTSTGLEQVLAGQAPTTSATGRSTTFNYLSWSDAQAVQDKITLAKKLGVAGIAIFKIDGGEDPALWNVLNKM